MSDTTQTPANAVDRDHEAKLKRLETLKADPNDPRHGTSTGVQIGCTCDRCKEKNRQTVKAHYDKVNRKVTGKPGVESTAWSAEDVKYLRETLDQPAPEVAAHLGRSMNAVLQKRQFITRNPKIVGSKRKPWTEDDIQYVKDHPDAKAVEIAEHLGRTIGAVRLQRSHIKNNS